jgi:hypothetical protein
MEVHYEVIEEEKQNDSPTHPTPKSQKPSLRERQSQNEGSESMMRMRLNQRGLRHEEEKD